MLQVIEHAKRFEYYQKQVMNPAVGAFGIHEVISELIGLCESEPDLPLVSVGCGIGLIEHGAHKNVKNPFFLVDPSPASYYPKLGNFEEAVKICGMPTTHASTKALIADHPEFRHGGSLLLLNWCGWEDGDTYDFEAIELLVPSAILVIYETTGSAGSPSFHAFLKTTTLYEKQTSCELFSKDACAHRNIVMQRWVLSEPDKKQQCRKQVFKCQLPHDSTNPSNKVLLKCESDRIMREMSAFADDPQLVSETVRNPDKMAKMMSDLELFLAIHKQSDKK